MHALKQYKRVDRGLPDYLNWGSCIAPGIVLCKDGSLLSGRYFKGRNLAHANDSDWYAVSESINKALCKLSGGWSIWVDDVRLPVSHFTDPVHNHFSAGGIAELIETERRTTLTQEGACLESEYVILLHYMPPHKNKGMLVNLLYDKDDNETARSSAASAILIGFQRTLNEFDDQVNAHVDLHPMQDRRWVDMAGRQQFRSDLVNYLNFCVSGELIDIPLPPDGCYLDAVIGEKTVVPGNFPKIGDMFVAAIGISGYPFPSGSTPGILTTLDLLPFPLRWSSRYIVLEQSEAEKQSKAIEARWTQKAKGLKGYLVTGAATDPDATEMGIDAADMLKRTRSATEGTGYYTVNVILMDENLSVLEENARVVRRVIRNAGYPTRLETINAMEAWLGSLPGHCVPNVRRSPIHTRNLADLLPLTAPWQGLPENPCPYYPPHSPPLLQAITVGLTPMNISLHTDDRAHCLTFGPIGSGKSTLLATVSAQALRYKNATVWAFDKGRSLMPTFRAIGRYYDIANDAMSFCPLAVLDTETDVSWAVEWIGACYHLQTGTQLQPLQTDAVFRAIQSLANSSHRSLSHFIRQVQDPAVRDAMLFYTVQGPLGHLTDAESDGLDENNVCGFEIGELMGMGERSLIPVLLHLFRRFTRLLKGQPAYLLLDEAWTMLGHPVWREKLREWLKELRKANVSVTMATQSLSDATRSGLLDVLLESCPTRFYGANPAAMIGTEDEPGPRQQYQKFGLTDAEIELIRQAVPKRHYLFSTLDGAALVDLRLGKKTLAFVGAGSKEQLAQVDYLFREYGNQWTTHWLQECAA